jgi:anthranilate/para-aminobenzoate synthase component I
MAEQNLESIYRQLVNPEAIRQYLCDQIDEFERIINDDAQFCEKEIQATKDFLQHIEEKLRKKINQCRDQLNKFQEENQHTHQSNTEEYEKEIERVNEAFSSGEHYDGKFLSVHRNTSSAFLFQHSQNSTTTNDVSNNVKSS